MSVIQQEEDHKLVNLCEYYYAYMYKECEAMGGNLPFGSEGGTLN